MDLSVSGGREGSQPRGGEGKNGKQKTQGGTGAQGPRRVRRSCNLKVSVTMDQIGLCSRKMMRFSALDSAPGGVSAFRTAFRVPAFQPK